jgi:putative tryptophan/tyrosine transport system substrate-binding protein
MTVNARFWWAGRGTRAFLLAIAALSLCMPSSPGVVAAQTPRPPALAQDGRGLFSESFETRAMFDAVWGDGAPAQWIQEHDAALSGGKPTTGPRIGYLYNGSVVEGRVLTDGFIAGLHDVGYEPGRNINIEFRFADGQNELLPSLAAELVALRVDLIVGGSAVATAAAKQSTSSIPVVGAGLVDPIGMGLVDSLERPGGNVTGVLAQPADLNAQRLALLKEMVPNATRLGVLVNPATPSAAPQLSDIKATAASLGLETQELDVRTADDLAGAFTLATQQHADALYLIADVVFGLNIPQLVQLATGTRIPAMYPIRTIPDKGGLMSYGIVAGSGQRREGGYVAAILHGTKPTDLPVVAPDQFELVVNLRAAQAIGYTFPPAVVARATEIIR